MYSLASKVSIVYANEYFLYWNPDPETYVGAELFAELIIFDEIAAFFFKLHLISFDDVCTIWQSVLSTVTFTLSLSLLLAGNPVPLMVICSPATEPFLGEIELTVGNTTN